MNKVFVTKRSIEDIKRFECINHSESNLFISKHDLLKFIKKEYLKERQSIVESLANINHKSTAYPIYTLHDKTGFIGYGMHYFKYYKEFDEFIKDESIPFKERKRIVLEICELFEFFEKNKFAYDDIHPGNILYYNGDIKLVDLDSGTFKNRNNGLDYDTKIRVEQTRLARFCLSTLYSIHPFLFDKYFIKGKTGIINAVPDQSKPLYRFATDGKFSHFSCGEYFSQIEEDTIEETKLLLKRN